MIAMLRRIPSAAPGAAPDGLDTASEIGDEASTDDRTRVPHDGVVRKCATAIHMAGKINLSQRRALNFLLYMALPQMPQRTRHRVSLNALAWAMTGDRKASRNLRTLIPDLHAMRQILVKWDVLGEDGGLGGWEGMLIPWLEISPEDGVVDYRFTPKFQACVARNGKAADIALRLQLVFRSVHTLALYEYTRYYLDRGMTPWLSLACVRKVIGLTEDNYQDFRKLSSRVIKRSVTEINDKSDLVIRVLRQRRAKGEVVAIRFTVSQATDRLAITPAASPTPPQLQLVGDASRVTAPTPQAPEGQSAEVLRARARLAEYAVPAKRAAELIGLHGAATVLTALVAADNWQARLAAQGENVRSTAAVAYKAIREHWQDGDDAATPVAERASNTPYCITAPKTPHDGRGVWCVQYLDRLSASDRRTTIADFERYLADPLRVVIRDAYRARGLTSRAVRGELQGYLGRLGISASDIDGPKP